MKNSVFVLPTLIGMALGMFFLGPLASFCNYVGVQGPPGPKGEPGDSIQGPQGLPGTECEFFCHSPSQLYIRCDGQADVEVTVQRCVGRKG